MKHPEISVEKTLQKMFCGKITLAFIPTKYKPKDGIIVIKNDITNLQFKEFFYNEKIGIILYKVIGTRDNTEAYICLINNEKCYVYVEN